MPTSPTTHSNSIRARILAALGSRAEALVAIMPDGLSQGMDLTWARQALSPGELPLINILPQPETAERSYGVDRMTFPVQIAVACLLGDYRPIELAEDLLAKMRSVLPAADPTLGGLAEDMRYTGGGVEDYPEDEDQALVVITQWEIVYETQGNDPDSPA